MFILLFATILTPYDNQPSQTGFVATAHLVGMGISSTSHDFSLVLHCKCRKSSRKMVEFALQIWLKRMINRGTPISGNLHICVCLPPFALWLWKIMKVTWTAEPWPQNAHIIIPLNPGWERDSTFLDYEIIPNILGSIIPQLIINQPSCTWYRSHIPMF